MFIRFCIFGSGISSVSHIGMGFFMFVKGNWLLSVRKMMRCSSISTAFLLPNAVLTF